MAIGGMCELSKLNCDLPAHTQAPTMTLVANSESPTSRLPVAPSTGSASHGRPNLLDLPNELIDMVGAALVSDAPIELSPFEDHCTPSSSAGNLTAMQYQHALNYQTKVRPTLTLLRVNKRLHVDGSKAYYSKNVFSFSGYNGWLVLARFFDLIGKANTQLLKHIVIVHPAHHKNVLGGGYEKFFARHMSPFGMTDLPNYARTYLTSRDEYQALLPVRDPLSTVRSIRGLESLKLLLYSHDHIHSLGYLRGGLWDLTRRLTTWSFDRDLSWKKQPTLQITLVNLSPCFELPQGVRYLRLAEAENASVGTSWYTHEIVDTHTLQGGDTVEAASYVALFVKDKGWKIEDHAWCPVTGVWPLQPSQAKPESELGPYIDDFEGWTTRDSLECAVQESLVDHLYRKHFDHQGQILESPAPVKHKDCVRCWRKGGFGGCICNNRPELARNGTLRANDILIGNPGTPHWLDEDKTGLEWAKSWAVNDAPDLQKIPEHRARWPHRHQWVTGGEGCSVAERDLHYKLDEAEFNKDAERFATSLDYNDGIEDRITRMYVAQGLGGFMRWPRR